MPRLILGAIDTKIYKVEFLSIKSLQSIGDDKYATNTLRSCLISAKVHVLDTKVA